MFYIISHRGGIGPTSRQCQGKVLHDGFDFPENTAVGFNAVAGTPGMMGIECDVFLTRDEQLVVIHDNELDRNVDMVTDVFRAKFPEKCESFTPHTKWEKDVAPSLGYVSDYTFEELQTYFTFGHGQKIITLTDFLEICVKNDKVPNIEIKGDAKNGYYVHKLLKELNYSGRYQITSFDLEALNGFSEAYKASPTICQPEIAFCVKTGMLHEAGSIVHDTRYPWVPLQDAEIDKDEPLRPKETDIEVFSVLAKKLLAVGINTIDITSSDLSESLLEACQLLGVKVVIALNTLRVKGQLMASAEDVEEQCRLESLDVSAIQRIEISRILRIVASNPVDVYFKVDHVQKAISLIEAAYKEGDVATTPLMSSSMSHSLFAVAPPVAGSEAPTEASLLLVEKDLSMSRK
ncbi:MAG: glycerophosphodiester phosphodiesterase family protein [Coxiellaceae bacterium]|nr:glycerophosphodiester phosphodiesterase family protein [Coxiellaceae bacterium]